MGVAPWCYKLNWMVPKWDIEHPTVLKMPSEMDVTQKAICGWDGVGNLWAMLREAIGRK